MDVLLIVPIAIIALIASFSFCLNKQHALGTAAPAGLFVSHSLVAFLPTWAARQRGGVCQD
jgi:amino acid permease